MLEIIGCICLIVFFIGFILLFRSELLNAKQYRETLKSVKISLQDIADYFVKKSMFD